MFVFWAAMPIRRGEVLCRFLLGSADLGKRICSIAWGGRGTVLALLVLAEARFFQSLCLRSSLRRC